jgi:hypothetical protein
MGGFSNYLEQQIIDATLRGVNITFPTTIYLALFKSDPTDEDAGNEVNAASYERQVITFSNMNPAANEDSISFSVALSDWGTITHFGIMDASESGNLLYYGALASSKEVTTGQKLVLPSGQLTIELD